MSVQKQSSAPLLPSGLRDILPPHAARERYITNMLLDRFALFGYEQASPPLLEFEESLLVGKGRAHAHNTFRVMDTASQKMMGLRADITTQIERIASRMNCDDAPVRLSYAGQVLRVAPKGLSIDRQLRQVGIEMIGHNADTLEVITASIEALQTLGLSSLVITLSYAGLFDALFEDCDDTLRSNISKAVINKDIGSLPKDMPHKQITTALIRQDIQAVLATTQLPEIAAHACRVLGSLASKLHKQFGNTITILPDPLDTDGFDYHQGTCFTILECDSRQEIGRGGSYAFNQIEGCGTTLYIERIAATAINTEKTLKTQHIASSLSYEDAKALRDQQITTITSHA